METIDLASILAAAGVACSVEDARVVAHGRSGDLVVLVGPVAVKVARNAVASRRSW